MAFINIKALIQGLLQLEKEIPLMEADRKSFLRFEDYENDVQGLRRQIEFREQLRQDMDSLMLAVKNSSATLERFESKAAKDRLTLAEMMKKKGGASLGDRDPVLISQRNALERALQKLDYFIAELDKVRAAVDQNYTAKALPELMNLNKALKLDAARWDDVSPAQELRNRLADVLGQHHLS